MQEPADVARRVRQNLPEGFRILECEALRPGGESLSRTIRGLEYRVELPEGLPDAAARLAEFAVAGEALVLREREGKEPVRVDLEAAYTDARQRSALA